MRHHLRILLTQRAGGRVAGVFERLLPILLLLAYQCRKALARHIHLAAHDQSLNRLGQVHRDSGDLPQIRRYVLAHHTVAARRTAIELSVTVFDRDRQAVDLRFDHIARMWNGLPHTTIKIPHLLLGEHVLQTAERHLVCHLGKQRGALAVHPLRIRVRRDELRILLLQRAQFTRQRIELIILDLGRIIIIIESAVIVNLRTQFVDSPRRLLHIHRCHLRFILSFRSQISCPTRSDHRHTPR